jgi:cardiolipin synthase
MAAWTRGAAPPLTAGCVALRSRILAPRMPLPGSSVAPCLAAVAPDIGSLLQSLTPSRATGATLLSIGVIAFDVWAISRTLTRGFGVQGTLSWLLAIVAFPFAGALAFFLFASPRVKRVRLRRRRSTELLRKSLGIAPPPRTASSATADTLVDLAASITGLAPSLGNEVAVLTDLEPTFERIGEAIAGARTSVWAEYYIIRNDATGRGFLEGLRRCAKRGVQVRLIYDAIGSASINAQFVRDLVTAGGEVRAFQPMNPLRRRLSVHLRNHRKLIVVDGGVGFTGGMNVGDEYSGSRRRGRGTKTFRDVHLELRGPAAHSLAQTFVEDWSFACGETLPSPPPPPPVRLPGSLVAIVPSGPDQEHNASAMVHFAAIACAHRSVYLTSPYFVPDDATVRALVSAALRRADVRILLPRSDHSDAPLVAWAGRSFYGQLLRGGVRLYEYEARMLHAKTLLVDGQIAFVGSANVDIRSFRLNFEVGALVNDREFTGRMEKEFVRELAHSHEVTLEMLERQGRFTRWRSILARLLSPIL